MYAPAITIIVHLYASQIMKLTTKAIQYNATCMSGCRSLVRWVLRLEFCKTYVASLHDFQNWLFKQDQPTQLIYSYNDKTKKWTSHAIDIKMICMALLDAHARLSRKQTCSSPLLKILLC